MYRKGGEIQGEEGGKRLGERGGRRDCCWRCCCGWEVIFETMFVGRGGGRRRERADGGRTRRFKCTGRSWTQAQGSPPVRTGTGWPSEAELGAGDEDTGSWSRRGVRLFVWTRLWSSQRQRGAKRKWNKGKWQHLERRLPAWQSPAVTAFPSLQRFPTRPSVRCVSSPSRPV